MTDKLDTPATVAPTIRFRARPSPDGDFAGPTADERTGSSVDDDAVGYARPPKQHRFKPGQSGNPKGRPKGARGFNAIVRTLLEEPVNIRTPRGTRRVPVIEVMLRRQIEQGSKGDHRAILALVKLYQMATPATVTCASDDSSRAPLDATDEMIIELMRQSLSEGGAP